MLNVNEIYKNTYCILCLGLFSKKLSHLRQQRVETVDLFYKNKGVCFLKVSKTHVTSKKKQN